MNTLHKCKECSYAATSKEGLTTHILREHVTTPVENRVVALPDGKDGYWVGRTYDAFINKEDT